MPIANYTTTVPVDRSVQHIMKMLAAQGAKQIVQDLGKTGVTGLSFSIDTEYGIVDFRLPVRIEGVKATLRRDGVPPRYQTLEHASRVAWRIAHDWLRAQLALIEAGMTTLPEVMFPYALVNPTETAFERYTTSRKELAS